MSDLTARQEAFVREYLVDLNATQAAIRAGYSEKGARTQGPELLSNPVIQAAVAAAQAERARRVHVTQDDVFRRVWAIASANPNDLIEYRRCCCRHCWGIDHAYQETPNEQEERRAQHNRDEEAAAMLTPPRPYPAFDEMGGAGFNATLDPNPACPECFGQGVGREFVKDTRHLPPEAQALYAGVKVTREGLEVKTHDQVAALQLVMRHMGMLNDKVKVDVGGTIHVHIDGNDADL